MIPLLDTSEDLDQCADELGCAVGQLLTPLTRFSLRNPDAPWAIDNGAFAGFDATSFENLLARERHHRSKCLFVTVPDVVGSARRTLEVFSYWSQRLAGWRVALACQDGQEDLPLPWDRIDAVFIGGSTGWKCSAHAVQIIQAAKILGKHVHVGRVNTAPRWKHFEKLGVDTIDGTGIAKFSHMREAIKGRDLQESMFA